MIRSAIPVAAVAVAAACGAAHHSATSTSAGSPAQASPAPARGVVYFQAGSDGDHLSLYSVGADGIGLTLARANGAISPDGSMAVRPDGRGVAITRLAGGSPILVHPPHGVTLGPGPISRDGTIVALEGSNGIYVGRPGGPAVTRITDPGTVHDVPLAWSPDGTRLLFARSLSGVGLEASDNLMVVKADGSGVVRINPAGTVSSTGDGQPDAAWSPDGSRIVFVANDGGGFFDGGASVYVADADGSHADVVPGTDRALWPSWSPDAKWIAYDAGPHHELFVVHPDGSGNRQLTNGGDGPFSVAAVWSPDSQALLFVRGNGEDFEHTELWTVRIDGTQLRQLTHRALQYDGYAWVQAPLSR
jgi:hypothetical protein